MTFCETGFLFTDKKEILMDIKRSRAKWQIDTFWKHEWTNNSFQTNEHYFKDEMGGIFIDYMKGKRIQGDSKLF